MKYRVDVVRIRENYITLNGWAIGRSPGNEAILSVEDEAHRALPFKLVRTRRDDVSQIHYHQASEEEYGFGICFPYERGKIYYLVISIEGRKARIKYSEELAVKRSSAARKRMEKIKDLCNMETVRVAFNYFRKYGLKKLFLKSKNKLQGTDSDYGYAEWYEKTRPTEAELQRQRETVFDGTAPLFSIVIPLFETPMVYLKALLDPLLAQTYAKFEVCLADGSRPEKDTEAVPRDYAARDSRIRYTVLGEDRGIADNMNTALALATGDFAVLCDHDDILLPEALFSFAEAIVKEPETDCLYSDKDKFDMDGGSLFDPHFELDFNPDLLGSVNYICHLSAVRKSLLDTVGQFDAICDGARDYDFISRVTEKARYIVHVPKVLCHQRCHMNSTASDPESKLYVFEAGARAIRAHYERVYPELKIKEVRKGVDYGIYHTIFGLTGELLVSVTVPNKDHREDLDKAVCSLLGRGTYKNLEFIVVENSSTDPETFAYYGAIQRELPQVKVIYYEGGFNFSKINNFGVRYARGEYLLFMNNDVELMNPDTVRELIGYGQREDVGAVGRRLLYEDDMIQHAGVVIGFGGIAGHTFIGLHEVQNSHFHRALTAQDYSAVTAACLLKKKELFLSVGGFAEEFAVAFNDIDYRLKVRAAGKLVVYNPYALLHHHGSKSRGFEDTPEKVERFNRGVARFTKRWPEILEKGDPYYSPNLTLRKSNFAPRDLDKEKIGEPYHMPGIEKYLHELEEEV